MKPERARPPARGTLRIAAGRWKGRRLEIPAGARPTSALAREALFDILQKRVPGARLLDLYAGSGAVGLEAASRGAARAVLVENRAASLRKNVASLPSPEGSVEVIARDAAEAVAELVRRGERFEIVFADPPYGGASPGDAVAGAAALLAQGGVLVLQTDGGDSAPAPPPGLRLASRRAYGRNLFWFFEGEGGSRKGPSRMGAF